MKALLVHGMFRTPVSMFLLGHRLEQRGLDVSYFGYSVSFELTAECATRLVRKIRQSCEGDYVLVSHSLGAVMIRLALPELSDHPPRGCYFLAPPSRACQAARHFVERWSLLRMLTRDAGALLADDVFMAGLPQPPLATTIYAGTAGPTGTLSPFGNEPNDTILTVDDTRVAGRELVGVPAVHTLIMNSKFVADDIASRAAPGLRRG